MKLRCNHCGEVIQSGIANVTKHVFEDCKAATTEKINEPFSITSRPFASFTPICHECNGEGSVEGKTGGSEGIPEADVLFVCQYCNGTGKIKQQ